jgi:hypothetical protein
MGESLLYEAVRKGIPLVEVCAKFIPSIDDKAAVRHLNLLAEDFHLFPPPYYDDPRLRVGSATKEALERLFGWELKRVPLERYDPKTKTWGHWPDVYRWQEMVGPTRFPVENTIERISISQPGADDNGQWYE